ncbi:MAG: FimB/Mfa2 family fimbrial subunit [Alistipes sp.]|nr:FimB/Mfa2 family fimbrial subunit [Alistipes sp.]
MKKIRNIPITAVGAGMLSIICAMFSCTRDADEIFFPALDAAQVTLSIQMPGLPKGNSESEAQTRAMPADEGTISEVEVLLFQTSGGNFIASYTGTNLQTDPTDASKRTFTLKLEPGTYDMMVLANSTGIISSAGLTADMTRAEVSEKLRLGQSGKWDITSSALFPFWGQLTNAVIPKGSASLGDIALNRAVAKIDIAMSAAVESELTLQTVSVYHWQSQMALIPDAGTMQGDEVIKASQTGTSLSLVPASGKITYSGEDIDNSESITSKIYLNETPNPGVSAFPVMPCLVVGGILEGYTQPRYYRIDLYSIGSDGTRNYRDLLRNHHYTITLSELLTNGSDDEEDAYRSTTASIETNIVDWNESDMGDIIIKGPWWLKVKPGEKEFPKNSNRPTGGTRAVSDPWVDNTIEIETNQPFWKIDMAAAVWSPAAQTGWLEFTPDDWNTGSTVEKVTVLLDENETGAPRSVKVPVVTDNIVYELSITQTEEEYVWLRVTDNRGQESTTSTDIIHLSYPGDEEEGTIIVEWFPEHLEIELDIQDGDYRTNIKFVPGFEIKEEKVTGGRRVYHYRLEKFDKDDFVAGGTAYGKRDCFFDFKAGNKTHRMNITHLVTDFLLDEYIYRMDIPYTSEINYNANVEVVSVEDPYQILTPASRQAIEDFNTNIPPGTISDNISRSNFPVTLQPTSADLDGKTATITVRPKDFHHLMSKPIKTIELEAYHLQPNSYIVPPGGSVHIPVRKAYRAWSQYPMNSRLDDSGPMSCEVVWQDVNGLITEVSLTPAHSQKDIDSEIFVRTSNNEGNAVVALKMGNDIVWSWHIWVTAYQPSATGSYYRYPNAEGTVITTFMDRNLGALTNNHDNENNRRKSQGLLYQYGRKDPFPAAQNIRDSTKRHFADNHIPVYPPGIFNSAPLQTSLSEVQSIAYSIANPTTHISANAAPFWWSNRQIEWRVSSNDVYYKNEFDPCPEGWNLANINQAWGTVNLTGNNQFFIPRPNKNTSDPDNDVVDFGYTRFDGYYMPSTGFINGDGYYQWVGYFASSYNMMMSGSAGYHRGQAIYADYTATSTVTRYSGQDYVRTLPVRCSRLD